MVATTNAPASPSASTYRSQARWAKPVKQERPNFIPPQSWLAYQWVDKDPELDFVKFAIAESGLTLEQIEVETEKNSHKVSRYTLMAWLYGSTKRPQNSTMNSVMAAIGWDRPWVRRG